MYRYNIPRTALVVFNLMALSVSILSRRVNAQHLTNFVDLNQSRQFFNQGNEIIEREIKWLQQDRELPKIERTKDRDRLEAINSDFKIDRHLILKPISEAEIDN